ncbi:unnamed protein product [Protopolystoma xenopodis]|uniref:Uncharacterized protein n=1 Tax=Protopolystoma xenopodis TaxID=117903 RepID=A0A3S5AH63_9PLAT|nr:unnamed protein product [Protopolystoma xenopodis]
MGFQLSQISRNNSQRNESVASHVPDPRQHRALSTVSAATAALDAWFIDGKQLVGFQPPTTCTSATLPSEIDSEVNFGDDGFAHWDDQNSPSDIDEATILLRQYETGRLVPGQLRVGQPPPHSTTRWSQSQGTQYVRRDQDSQYSTLYETASPEQDRTLVQGFNPELGSPFGRTSRSLSDSSETSQSCSTPAAASLSSSSSTVFDDKDIDLSVYLANSSSDYSFSKSISGMRCNHMQAQAARRDTGSRRRLCTLGLEVLNGRRERRRWSTSVNSEFRASFPSSSLSSTSSSSASHYSSSTASDFAHSSSPSPESINSSAESDQDSESIAEIQNQ